MTIAIDFVGINIGSGTKTYNVNFCNELETINLNEEIIIFVCKNYINQIADDMTAAKTKMNSVFNVGEGTTAAPKTYVTESKMQTLDQLIAETIRDIKSKVINFPTNNSAFFSPFLFFMSKYIGTKALFIAPSAKIFLDFAL